MEAFKGKYDRTSDENYDKFLQALGVSLLLRTAAKASTPRIEITETNAVWTIKSSTILKTIKFEFKLNEEFEETTPDGRQVQSLATLEDGKLVLVQKAKKEKQKSTRTVHERNGADELVLNLTVDGDEELVCVQKFKRV